MKKSFILFAVILVLSVAVYAQKEFKITLKNKNSESELKTKNQLLRLIKTYNLYDSKWIFTKEIIIDRKSIPTSHPVLTLHTRHLKDDELLLSTFIHEQAHRFLSDERRKERDAAVKELEKMFPKVPVGFPKGGRSEFSTYQHILIIYLEYRGVQELLGELKAKQVMDFWATDHYTWIYKTVLEKRRDVGKIVFKHNLFPKSKPTKNKER